MARKKRIHSAAVEALITAAERLEVLNPEALDKVLAAAQAFVATHDDPDEPQAVFDARVARIGPRRRWETN